MKPLWRLVQLIKPQLPLMLLGSLLAIITVLANISLLAVSGWFITTMAIAGAAGVSTNYFTPGAVIRFLAIVRTSGRYAERLLTHRATFNTLAALRYYFYSRLEPLLPYYSARLQAADMLARLQQDIDQLDNFYLRVLLPFILALVSVPLLAWGISFISPALAMFLIVALIFVGVLLPVIMLLVSHKRASQQAMLASQLQISLVDGIAAMRDMLIYQIAQPYQQSMAALSQRYHENQLQLHRLQSLTNAITFLTINTCVFACFYLLIPQVQTGNLTPALVAGTTLLVLVCFETVINMPLACQILPQVHASAKRLFEIIDKPLPRPSGSTAVTTGAIRFTNLSFRYPESDQDALHNINLAIAPGEKVAIIGASGAGKSTLVNLLMGFWPTTPASLTIAGVDINQLCPQSLRQHISLLSQHGHLFHATIADNLRLANPDASEQQMREVCAQTGLLSFIDELPAGLNTWLGETGSGLSGGQSQRLKLSQVLLRHSQLLILDEPTKGLDRQSEQVLIAGLFEHLQTSGQSMLMITHKPLMLQNMDRIVVLEKGRIIAQGAHTELLAGNEYYRQLLNYF